MHIKLKPTFVLFVFSLLVAGCEQLPSGAIVKQTPKDTTVSREGGRGGYDWPVEVNRFIIQRRFEFPEIEKFEPESLGDPAGPPAYVEGSHAPFMDQVSDPVRRILAGYLLPPSEAESILELKSSEEIRGERFSINYEGTRLVTIGKAMIVWDLTTGKELSRHEYNGPTPSEYRLERGDQTVVSYDDRSVRRIHLDGTPEQTWDSPAGKITAFTSACNVSMYAALTETGELVYLDESLSPTRVAVAADLRGMQVSLHPDGKFALLTNGLKMLKFRTDDPQAQPEQYDLSRVFDRSGLTLCGATYDRAVFPHEVFEHSDQIQLAPDQDYFTQVPILFHRDVSFAFGGTKTGEEDWLIVGFEQTSSDGKAEYAVCDWVPRTGAVSLPIVIAREKPYFMASNADGGVIGYCDSSKTIHVKKRRPWTDPDGSIIVDELARLVMTGQGDEVDKCAEFFRSTPMFCGRQSGEEIFLRLASKIGSNWQNLIDVRGQKNADEMIAHLETWRDKRSMLSRMANVYRLVRFDPQARFNMPGNLAEVELRRAYEQLTAICAKPDAPTAAFGMFCEVTRLLNADTATAEHQAAISLERYPQEHRPQASMMAMYVPDWGGEQSKPGAYLASVCKRLPREEQTMFYAKTALRVLRIYDVQGARRALGLDVDRILAGGEQLAAVERVNLDDMAILISLAQLSGRTALKEKWMDESIRRFPRASQLLHDATLRKEYVQRIR